MKKKTNKRGLPPQIEQLPEQQQPVPPGGWPDQNNPWIALRGTRAPTFFRVGIKEVFPGKWGVYVKRSGRGTYVSTTFTTHSRAAEKAKNLVGQSVLIVWDKECNAL